jgi:hypothetical protein
MRPRKGAHLGWSMCRPPPRVELVEGRRRCGCDPDRFPPPSRARQRRRKGRRRRRRKGEPEAARCGRRRADAGGYRHVGRHRRRGLFMPAVRAVVGGFLRLGTPAVAIERLWFGWGLAASPRPSRPFLPACVVAKLESDSCAASAADLWATKGGNSWTAAAKGRIAWTCRPCMCSST